MIACIFKTYSKEWGTGEEEKKIQTLVYVRGVWEKLWNINEVPASQRVSPAVIKPALLMMELSLSRWWGKERDKRPANWSQFLHGWMFAHACVCVVCKRHNATSSQCLCGRNTWFLLILLHVKNISSARLHQRSNRRVGHRANKMNLAREATEGLTCWQTGNTIESN